MKISLPFALACALAAQQPPAPRPRPQQPQGQPQGQSQTQQARPGRGGPFASAPAATAAPVSGTASLAGRVLDGGAGNAGYKTHEAFCLETQHYPDAPNQASFPTTVLRPREKFHQVTTFTFGK